MGERTDGAGGHGPLLRTALMSAVLVAVSTGVARRFTALVNGGGRRAQSPVELISESDGLSLAAATHLAEFDVLRREVELKIQQFEQTYIYLYAFIGAILASQFLLERFPDLERGLRNAPIVYPAVALMLLWFPMNAVVTLTNIALLAGYIATVLSPKLTALSEHIDRQTDHGRAYLAWEREAFPTTLRGQLRWENYLTLKSHRRTGGVTAMMLPLSILRVGILYVPAGLVMARYVAMRGASQASSSLALSFEVIALLAIAIVAVASAFIFVVELRDIGWFRLNLNRWRTSVRE